MDCSSLKKLGLQLINSNYRPVSNLTFLSKLIKKCMWSQLNTHCLSYNLQPDYQSGYRPGYSCETSLLWLSNDILWSFERQSITSLTALDLSMAFNTVGPDVLLKTLTDKFGVTDWAMHWFEEYLQPCSFKVLINKSYSDEIDLKYSVPERKCCWGKYLQSMLQHTTWGHTRWLTAKWICWWPQCEMGIQGS